MKQMIKNETGYTIVEATIVFPVTIFVFFVLLYASLFLCQRANLQTSLEDALIYFKQENTDTYVFSESQLEMIQNGENISKSGNTYGIPRALDPYRNITSALKNESIVLDEFVSFFKSRYNQMFFRDGNDVKISIDYKNYIIYKEIIVKAQQTVVSPVNIAIIGASNTMDLHAQASVVVVDGDDFIRDVDFASDVLSDTKFGKAANEAVGEAVKFYDKVKSIFGI